MIRLPALAAALVTFAALAVPAGSRGQNLEISPVLVDLSAGTPSAVVTVKNLGSAPMRYQVTAFRWTEDRSGKPGLEPSQEFSIFPPLFQLEGGATRKVRVGATVPPEAKERSWRIVVEELPDAVARSGTRVIFRTRFAIPVFLAPPKPETRCELGLGPDGNRIELVVTNLGNVRVKPLSTGVKLFDAAGVELKELEVVPWYVLAGSERAWVVKVPDELCSKVRRAKFVAEVAGKRLEASRELPGGACDR